MTDKEKMASVENILVQRYKSNGYLLEDEVIDCCVDHGLELTEIDALCDRLLKRNIIFRDSPTDNVNYYNDDNDEIYDKSHIDYDEFFDQIISEYPSCKSLVEEIRKILPPQHREWKTLIGEAKNGNDFARERLILMYLRTIMKRAYDFSKQYYCEFDDCFQNAVIGFINAIDKYDVTNANSFASYFTLWLVQSMSRECIVNGTILRYPVHYKDKIMAVFSKFDKSWNEIEELAVLENNIIEEHESVDDYFGIYSDFRQLISDDFLRGYNDSELDELDYNHLIPYTELFDDIYVEEELFEGVIIEERNKTIRGILDKYLSDREKYVVEKRFGFDDGISNTLEEVGLSMGVTRERVRQIEQKALKKLKWHLVRELK